MFRNHPLCQIRGPATAKRRRGVIIVLASVVLSVLFAFMAFGVDTGRMVMTQTHMQNAADAACLAAAQEIMATIDSAGEQFADNPNMDLNELAIANAKQVAQEIAAENGVYIDPDRDVRFGQRILDEQSGEWNLTWDKSPFNTVQVIARRDNPDLTQPDAQLRMAFGWAVGKPSMPISVSGASFIESRDLVLVLDFSSSMNDDSELKSIDRFGRDAIEDNLAQIYEELGSPDDGGLTFEPQFLTLESPDPQTETQAKVKVTFQRETAIVESSKALDEVKIRYENGNIDTYSGLTSTSGTFQGSGNNAYEDITSIWVTSGQVGQGVYDPVTLTGNRPTNKKMPQIEVTFFGTYVYIESSKDLSNVVLEFSDGTRYKFDNLTNTTGTFQGIGSDEGKFITNVWVKSGENQSGDGPGYGEKFNNTQVEGEFDLEPEQFRFDDTNENVMTAFGLDSTPYPYPNGSWLDVLNYARFDSDVRNAGYRKMYGTLIWMNYLLDGRNRYTSTPDLWKTSHYPFHAVKNGTSLFTQFLESADFGDELGLVSYDTTARIETGLYTDSQSIDLGNDLITSQYSAIDAIQRHKQAGHYGSGTGLGDSIKKGWELLDGDATTGTPGYSREGTQRTLIVLTDGQANQYPENWSLPKGFKWSDWTDFDGDGTADFSSSDLAKQYAFWQATQAIEKDIKIHTMSVGAEADTQLMEAIAKAGKGTHINVPAESTVAEMESQMLAAFSQIAADVPPPKLVYDKATE